MWSMWRRPEYEPTYTVTASGLGDPPAAGIRCVNTVRLSKAGPNSTGYRRAIGRPSAVGVHGAWFEVTPPLNFNQNIYILVRQDGKAVSDGDMASSGRENTT
jgi:hypothetical protein